MHFDSPNSRLPLMFGTFVLTLIIPLVLIIGSARLLVTPVYLSIEYNKPDFPPDDYGFTLADRLHYGPYALDYMITNADISYLGNLKFPNGAPFYSSRELQHMADVQHLTQIAFDGLFVFIVVLLILIALLSRSTAGRAALRWGIFNGGLLTALLIVGLAVGVFVNWDAFFTQFHELFFSNGTWQFSYSDSLIRLYPVRFWQDAALTIGGLALVTALILMAVSWLWMRRVHAHSTPITPSV